MQLIKKVLTPIQQTVFTDVSKKYGINFKPKERDFIDYNIQPTIPHKLSQYGPGIAVGDIDNNGFDDFYIGGSSGNQVYFLCRMLMENLHLILHVLFQKMILYMKIWACCFLMLMAIKILILYGEWQL